MSHPDQPKRQAALGFIFVTLLIDITGFGIIIPVIPKLLEHLIHGNLSDAARYGGWMTFAYSIMQFLFAPVLGNLSDKYGRRPILLGSLLGFAIDYTFLAFAPTVWWLFVGRIIAGITGASFTTASAYIADISEPEKRAQNFGIIGAAFGIGFIIGPVLGGVLGQYSTKLPFLAAAGLALVNAIYGFFILPESLAPENRRAFEWKRANPVGSLMQLKKYPAVSGLIASLILIYIAAHAVQSTWTFFTMSRFGWTEALVGYSLGLIGLLSGLVQGLLIRVTIPKLGQKKSIVLGLLLYSIALFLFAFASQSWMMFAILSIYCLGGIAGPALQGLISTQIPPNEQGELQGGLTSLMSVTSIIGPPLMTTLFAWFTGKSAPIHFPGAPFLMGAVLMLASTLLAIRNFKRARQKNEAA
ncbi:TCR/Tet family MFS transporter [Mucilaginibacter polytrichastri]|uniref:Tetracycline resistance protein, class C n=1 Tax=Mucilaginibacter polytrichastri TaxID=1302689 RepID=A0A1Q5ZX95_9SPHI|nr:TCR/Tet family MFS transporter [Mucilaginibacter polytrichastri]OKS86362.1 Tetracycline resistance protein, class C [Mucilaginibacter polytrichastri]SFT20918.1 MFS transporter, DHA1 family, tetracycline resistance protein [Mucilaginibacter polytrichastri]